MSESDYLIPFISLTDGRTDGRTEGLTCLGRGIPAPPPLVDGVVPAVVDPCRSFPRNAALNVGVGFGAGHRMVARSSEICTNKVDEINKCTTLFKVLVHERICTLICKHFNYVRNYKNC